MRACIYINSNDNGHHLIVDGDCVATEIETFAGAEQHAVDLYGPDCLEPLPITKAMRDCLRFLEATREQLHAPTLGTVSFTYYPTADSEKRLRPMQVHALCSQYGYLRGNYWHGFTISAKGCDYVDSL